MLIIIEDVSRVHSKIKVKAVYTSVIHPFLLIEESVADQHICQFL